MKYFNVLIYCKISCLNRNRKFKKLIKILKYYMEMYINNFSGNALTYLEIDNEHYKNFEKFQSFCYKYFKDDRVLKNFYLKSVFTMDKKKELLEHFVKLDKKQLILLCKKLKYITILHKRKKMVDNCDERDEIVIYENGKLGVTRESNKLGTSDESDGRITSDDDINNEVKNFNMKKARKNGFINSNNAIFDISNLFIKKKKLFYITLLIENLSYKSNIFEDVDKQCDYPNEIDLFENVLIDTKDDLKNREKKKKNTFFDTKPLFKLNLQYLCINDYIYRIYNLFKLQSYYDIRKNIIEYVYETNPKNKKINENTICNYVFEIDERNQSDKSVEKKRLNNLKSLTLPGQDTDNDFIQQNKKQKFEVIKETANVVEKNKLVNSKNRYLINDNIIYNEYQLNSIIHDVNEIDNTYFANERRMSNKIDSFKVISVDDNTKKIIAEIIIDLKYKYHERAHMEWNMIKTSDILFVVCVKNYTNYYKNKINVISDNDLKNLLGINYVRGCEVVKYENVADHNADITNENRNIKKITVYLDYAQYKKDLINNPEIYSSFNLLIRRKQKENNFYDILNNIKILIMNPDSAIIPYWVHDIFLGYCNNSLKYYQELPHKKENDKRYSDQSSDESSENDVTESDTAEDDSISEDSVTDDSDIDDSLLSINKPIETKMSEDENGVNDSTNKRSGTTYKQEKTNKMSIFDNNKDISFVQNNIDDINYLNTFVNIKHVLNTTNVVYVCIDSSYILNDSKDSDITNVKKLLNEFVEPLFLSYIPIKYKNEKKALQKNIVLTNILQSLKQHICIINKQKMNDDDFVVNFMSNIIKVGYLYENFVIFEFEFQSKKYFLILNNYLNKLLTLEERTEFITYVRDSCQDVDHNGGHNGVHNDDNDDGNANGEVLIINNISNIKNIFKTIVNRLINYLSLKDDIYRIVNKIYEYEDYPLEGLLIHSKKINSTNVDFGNINNGYRNNSIKNTIHFTARQIECIKSGIYKGITLIEGVPGSGKTSILNKIINILFNNHKKQKILICTHSNSCLNYIFNFLVKENLIHQKYLCRVGMGELDIENLRNEYEEIEKRLTKNSNQNNTNSNKNIIDVNDINAFNKPVNELYDEDDNFNFSKYGRINYMIDLRNKLLNEVNLLEQTIHNKKIYNCLSAIQYYEIVVKNRITKFFKYANTYLCQEYDKNENIDEFIQSYVASCNDEYDLYNLFLCPKIYVKDVEKLEHILCTKINRSQYDCKVTNEICMLDEDRECFYLIHPRDQIKSLNLSIYNVIFPFKKYVNIKVEKVNLDHYVQYKNSFINEVLTSTSDGGVIDSMNSTTGIFTNGKAYKNMNNISSSNNYVNNGENEKKDNVITNNVHNVDKDVALVNKKECDYSHKTGNNIHHSNSSNNNNNNDAYKIFKGETHDIVFENKKDDLYVSKYYLLKLVKIFEHLNDCRAFEVLKNQKERGVYIIAKLARVIAMTCTHASINRSKIAKLQFYFDNIIIDECTQITENDTFLPLLLQENRYDKSKLKRIIFVGDSNQLPPIIKNKYIKNYANYEQSLYKRFLRLGLPSIYLNEQGRMRSEICNVYKYFYTKYNTQIQNLSCIDKDKFLKKFNPGFTYTYQFIHVESEEYTPVPYFYQNLLEAEMAVAIFMYMRLLGYSNDIITILTTYNGQKELILDILKKNCLYNKLIGMPKKVTTVDKYQGKQNDYVIVSLVRSRSIGYMKNIKRLIVAFSRARYGLYVLGNYNLYKKNYEFKKPLYFF
uniref:P-loop containing nucleoside triphosphate hydrolase n=1 Tax=Piliocolobus tephrosceles TaxID=591936 RepID=A0A8C9LJT8_9PRIM